ncbi:hypothetical protein [Streptomyces sp. ITFR-6]|uniref:hypothetical protein n=1 Tax=Streptomyces sp. ITFR-6 TaxID=3075197 RepID=UPI00288997C5|nr:hypothetical protein [Streptomyces sp. ITFR-6]WNI31499.1 hypothetical protein RLT59_23920 [Streptomyces sp. ITFR-6]
MSVEATGIPAIDAVLVWGGVGSVVMAAGAALWRITRGVLHMSRRVELFMDDWSGAEERPGVPGRPGVMARLGGFEDRMTRVEHELYPNSGESLRDAVDLANQRLALMCPDDPDRSAQFPSPAPAGGNS